MRSQDPSPSLVRARLEKEAASGLIAQCSFQLFFSLQRAALHPSLEVQAIKEPAKSKQKEIGKGGQKARVFSRPSGPRVGVRGQPSGDTWSISRRCGLAGQGRQCGGVRGGSPRQGRAGGGEGRAMSTAPRIITGASWRKWHSCSKLIQNLPWRW